MQTLSAHARSEFSAVLAELGLEPAIETAAGRPRPLEGRRVSLRWLFGTVLTGLAGAALFSAATYAALDRQSNFAEEPLPALPAHKDADSGVNPEKGDRLVKEVDIVADKQTFKAPTTIKIGDKEVVKDHSFTHIETNLLTTSAGFADDVPPFNPLQLLADARNPVDTQPEPDDDDGDVSWSVRDMPLEALSATAILSPEEVQAQVAEQERSTLAAGSEPFTIPPQLLLMRTSRANPLGALAYASSDDLITTTPFSQIEVRMVPENVTVVPRSPAVQPTQMQERLIVLRHGDTLESALQGAGIDEKSIASIVAAFAPQRGQPVVPEGRRLELLMADLDGSGVNMSLARLCVYNDETLETTIAITDRGDYARVEDSDESAAKNASDDSDDNSDSGMQLYQSFYETALKQQIPRPMIDELVRIFANDVDFQSPVSNGDSFEILYDNGEDGEQRNELLYAAIIADNQTYRYYRYQTPDDGLVDFYDENGRSSRKFLIRVPIIGARMTSPFGIRFHPILGYTRPHTGVDWAAPIGTPIFAAGNGTIAEVGWDSGYGRRIEIQHANGYMTTYNHLSGFARGIKEGVHVKQGQVIGYLGETGLATGPHLHYEVLVNGHFVDPMRVKLARTREFDGKMLADFKRERDRIDALVARAPNGASLVASKDK